MGGENGIHVVFPKSWTQRDKWKDPMGRIERRYGALLVGLLYIAENHGCSAGSGAGVRRIRGGSVP